VLLPLEDDKADEVTDTEAGRLEMPIGWHRLETRSHASSAAGESKEHSFILEEDACDKDRDARTQERPVGDIMPQAQTEGEAFCRKEAEEEEEKEAEKESSVPERPPPVAEEKDQTSQPALVTLQATVTAALKEGLAGGKRNVLMKGSASAGTLLPHRRLAPVRLAGKGMPYVLKEPFPGAPSDLLTSNICGIEALLASRRAAWWKSGLLDEIHFVKPL